MAHTITGIDLGSWAVKFTVLDVGFRHTRVASTFEERVAADERPLAERQYEALRQGASRAAQRDHGLPGVARRHAHLARAGAALRRCAQDRSGRGLRAGRPDHPRIARRDPGPRGAVGARAGGRRQRRGAVRWWWPRASRTCATSWRRCRRATWMRGRSTWRRCCTGRKPPRSSSTTVHPGCRVIADIGHRRTNLCFVVGDEAVFARTLSTGARPSPRAFCAPRREPGPGSRPSRARRRSASWPAAAGPPPPTWRSTSIPSCARPCSRCCAICGRP
jgi:hypothetical protein